MNRISVVISTEASRFCDAQWRDPRIPSLPPLSLFSVSCLLFALPRTTGVCQ